MNRNFAARSSLLLLLFAWSCLVAAGCAGGSGSSGFDLSPSLEGAHIHDVLDERECQELNGVAICPTDQSPLALPPATLPDPAESDVRLDTGLAGIDVLACPAAPCQVQLQLAAAGLPPGSILQVAVRDASSLGPWRLEPAVALATDRVLSSAIDVPDGVTSIQAAVLVYVGVEPLAAGELDLLSASGAALVFVSAPLSVTP